MSFATRICCLLAATLLGISGNAAAHFEPTVISNPTPLAQAVAGTGVTITNATITGFRFQSGTFTDSLATLGVNDGIVLSTGDIRDMEGTNDGTNISTNFGLGGDNQLSDMATPYQTFDAAILEFDVTTTQSTIGISYIFGSEDYIDRIGTPFADVMGIFVNGVNCANFNGKPVSVNTINANMNAAQFVDNSRGVRLIELNGLTKQLECVAAVTPNAPNHVRLAIADTGDGTLDSAIMLPLGAVYAPGIGPTTTSTVVKAIEYYHQDFDHYFVTSIPDEITKLDNGTLVGWARTGFAFNVFDSGVPNPVVCRFFSTAFGTKSSHFYTPNAPECATVKTNPDWQFEGEVFNVDLPVVGTGACPAGMLPLYRMYNNGQGGAPNHRYTIDVSVREQMLALGWIPEGEGIGVIACVPM